MRTTYLSLVFLLLALALTALGSCAAPTQIILHLHTDVACSTPPWPGVAVYVGAPDGSLEDKLPVLSEQHCDANGEVGTLVITPSGEKNAEVGLRVVAGIERRPEDCAKSSYQGCIVARRAVRFDRHETIHVDVRLTRSCIDFGCGTGSTCVDGECKQLAEVPNDSNPGVEPDASAPNGRVRCGDNGLFCPTEGNVCCLTVDRVAKTASGACQPADTCVLPKIVLRCDDESDCAALTDDRGHPGSCILSYTDVPGAPNSTSPDVVSAANCAPYSVLEGIAGKSLLALCNDHDTCMNGTALCGASDVPIPNYMWCAVKAPFAESQGAPRVRCGDDGVECGIDGDVCCLTLDRAAGRGTGKCQPASTCPRGSIVLNCDDETDCAAYGDDAGVPGDCILDHTLVTPDNHGTVAEVFSSSCTNHANLFVNDNNSGGFGLCVREQRCRGTFPCVSSETQMLTPTNPLPGYFWCYISN